MRRIGESLYAHRVPNVGFMRDRLGRIGYRGGSSDVNVLRGGGREGKLGQRGGGSGRRRCRVECQPTRFSRTCTASSASSELVRACETIFLPSSSVCLSVSFSLSLSVSLSTYAENLPKLSTKQGEQRERSIVLFGGERNQREQPAAVSVRLHRFFKPWVREP